MIHVGVQPVLDAAVEVDAEDLPVVCGCVSPGIDFDARDDARSGPRLPVLPYPDTYERQLARNIRPLVDMLREETAALAENLGRYSEVEDGARADGPRRMSKAKAAALRAAVEAMADRVAARWTEAAIVRTVKAEALVTGVDNMNQRATLAQLAKAIELSPLEFPPEAVAFVRAADGSFSEAKADRWARENVKLISKMADDHLDRVAKITREAVRAGSRAEVVAGALREATGISARKAKGIARDQIATLQGQVTQARQTRIGVKRYRWRTVGDARVRTTHRQREGEIFSWDRPPPDGHPGAPINCRCYAEPVLDDVLADISRGAKTT